MAPARKISANAVIPAILSEIFILTEQQRYALKPFVARKGVFSLLPACFGESAAEHCSSPPDSDARHQMKPRAVAIRLN